MARSATQPRSQDLADSPRAREILEAATRLFHAEGYHVVGMRRIAKEIGMQTAGLYYYFPSKSEILYVICLEVTKNFVDQHLPILYGEAPAPELLKQLVRQHILYFWDHRHAMDVALGDHRILPAVQREDIRSHRRRYQTAIQAFIAEGVKRGDFNVPDARLAGIAVLDMINGINNWFKPGHSLLLEELASRYAEMAVGNLLDGAREGKNV
jgi:AcrR family transcriptional regulator